MILTVILYTLATIVLFCVVLSYILAYSLRRSKSVLALLLFLSISLVLKVILVYDLWGTVLGMNDRVYINFASLRAFLFLIALIFLLHTTWQTEEEETKKIDDETKTNVKQKLKLKVDKLIKDN